MYISAAVKIEDWRLKSEAMERAPLVIYELWRYLRRRWE